MPLKQLIAPGLEHRLQAGAGGMFEKECWDAIELVNFQQYDTTLGLWFLQV